MVDATGIVEAAAAWGGDAFALGGAAGAGGTGSGGGEEALESAKKGSSTGGVGTPVVAFRRAWAAWGGGVATV